VAEQTSARAALLLGRNGVPGVRALIGGYEEWEKRGDPVVKGDRPK
jgi:3-mercaptopyruvate sulfurtransferase SseA